MILQLAHHTQHMIVEYHNFDRQFLFQNGSQFMHTHLETSVTGHRNHQIIRAGNLRTYCCGNPIAHGAQTSRADEFTRCGKIITVGSPNLMLPNVRSNNGFFFIHQRFHQIHRPRHIDSFRGGQRNRWVQRLAYDQFTLFLQLTIQVNQNRTQISHNRNINFYVFPNFRWIHIHMNNLCIGGKTLGSANHTIIKTHTQS